METSVVKRFLRYIAVDTQSAAEKDVIPSTAKQFDLAKILVEELKEMGAQDVKMDNHAYVYATVPATSEKKIPVLGLIAHMDTSPACSGKNVNPQFINNYDGKDILMNKETGLTMKVEDYPELLNYKGQDLITTDGTTLLGADDKAGRGRDHGSGRLSVIPPGDPTWQDPHRIYPGRGSWLWRRSL